MSELTREQFSQVDMRVGTIIDVQNFPEAKRPAYKLHVDLGDLGTRKTSAQITDMYTMDELLNKQVICVVNFPPKQIGKFMSEILVLGLVGGNGGVVLLSADKPVKNGLKVA